MTPQRSQLAPSQWVGAGRAVLEAADVEAGRLEIDLVPAQVTDFSRPQTVPEGQEHHERVAVTIAVVLGPFD
jgi:hypothetical protein